MKKLLMSLVISGLLAAIGCGPDVGSVPNENKPPPSDEEKGVKPGKGPPAKPK